MEDFELMEADQRVSSMLVFMIKAEKSSYLEFRSSSKDCDSYSKAVFSSFI